VPLPARLAIGLAYFALFVLVLSGALDRLSRRASSRARSIH
jgi:hypothetical protein